MDRRSVKIAYIGGGSKAWARSFMQDLALAPDLAGEVALYDIDVPAAERNRIIGTKIQEKEAALSDFVYTVSATLEEALTGADFVIISILPGILLHRCTRMYMLRKNTVFCSPWVTLWDLVGSSVHCGLFLFMRDLPRRSGNAVLMPGSSISPIP